MSKLINRISELSDQQPNKISLRSEHLTLSYSELYRNILEVETWFSQLRLKRIAIWMDNSIEWVVMQLAAFKTGITVVPVPTFFSQEQVLHLLSETQPELIISNLPLSGLFCDSAPVDFPGLYSVIAYNCEWDTALQVDRIEDVALITYTSGSTGNPKGVLIGHSLLDSVCQGLAESLETMELTRHACVLPLAVMLENIAGVFLPLYLGAEIHIQSCESWGVKGSSQVDASSFLVNLMRIQPETLILTPELLKLLLGIAVKGTDLSFLKFIAVGGGKVPLAELQLSKKLELPVYEGYGLTECGSVVALNTPALHKRGSVGIPLPHLHLSFNPAGEILVSGACMSGYLGDAENSIEQINTGDLGYLDEEGFLYVTGRSKNLQINSYGRNFSPEWIEAKLNGIPGVIRSVVYGESLPSIRAFIQLVEGTDEKQIEHGLREVNLQLPDYARVWQWKHVRSEDIRSGALLTANGRPRRDQFLRYFDINFEFKEVAQ